MFEAGPSCSSLTMEESAKSATTVKDPVCGMDVEPSTARHKLDHAGKTYYFCCASCLERFRAHPDEYLKPRPASAAGLQIINIAPATPKETLTQSGFAIYSRPQPALTFARCVRRCARPGRRLVRVAAWRLSGKRHWPRREWNIPARCIRRSCGPGRATVRSAAWRWNRARSPDTRKKTLNYGI